MLELLSEKLVTYFNKQLELTEIQRLKMTLGFESLLHHIILLATISILSGVLNIFYPACLFLLIFGTYRIIAGGFHLNTSLGCTIVTTTIIVGGAKIASVIYLNIFLTSAFLMFSIYLVIALAPRHTKNYPLTIKEHRHQKLKAFILVTLLSVIAIGNFFNLREIITIAITVESLTLLPNPQKY